jgi:NADP-reducing hydrogenase subunit HndC
MSLQVDSDRCRGCRLCANACPKRAITFNDEDAAVIGEDLCNQCGTCTLVCPVGAISEK